MDFISQKRKIDNRKNKPKLKRKKKKATPAGQKKDKFQGGYLYRGTLYYSQTQLDRAKAYHKEQLKKNKKI
jgi:hypothetical protein